MVVWWFVYLAVWFGGLEVWIPSERVSVFMTLCASNVIDLEVNLSIFSEPRCIHAAFPAVGGIADDDGR